MFVFRIQMSRSDMIGILFLVKFPKNNCVPSHWHRHYHHINIKCHVHHIKTNHSPLKYCLVFWTKGRYKLVVITYMNENINKMNMRLIKIIVYETLKYASNQKLVYLDCQIERYVIVWLLFRVESIEFNGAIHWNSN